MARYKATRIVSEVWEANFEADSIEEAIDSLSKGIITYDFKETLNEKENIKFTYCKKCINIVAKNNYFKRKNKL